MSEDDSRKDIINNKENVVTTCSNYTTTINKPEKFVTSAYLFGRRVSLRVPKELWRNFKKLSRLEGLSASKVLEKAVIEYVKTHSRGNPQLLMAHYVKPEEPQPLRVLCFFCQGATNDGRVFCKRKEMWIGGVECYSCKQNRLRKKG